jgi:hypothetical protein
VDVGQRRLDVHARAAVLHIQRVGHAHHAGLERQRPAVLAVADDRVQDLGGDHGPLGVLVDVREQAVEQVGGEEEAERLVVDAVDRHAEVVQQAAAGDDHLGILVRHRVVGLDRRLQPAAVQQPEQVQRAVEDDLEVDPRVVGHVQPFGGHLLAEPARLELVAGVGRLEEAGELRVALGRGVDAHRRDGLARRARAGGRRLGSGLAHQRPVSHGVAEVRCRGGTSAARQAK